jgi:hypothetical protein
VKSAPVLCVTLQPSRIAARLLASVTVATAAMLAGLPGDPWLRGACVLIAGACGICALRRATTSGDTGSIAAVDLAADRRAIFTDRSGRRIEAIVQGESHVGALVTTLVLRPEGSRRSRALAIWPDTMPAGEFRRLRVLLRHGDPGSART